MLRAYVLPVRLGRDQPLQLGHELVGAPERELGVVEELDCTQPLLIELSRLRLVDGLAGEIRERLPAPEIEPAAEVFGRIGSPPRGESRDALVDEALEPAEVERRRVEMEAIARAVALDPFAAERASKPVHVHLQRGDRRARRLGSPERVDEAVPRNDRVRVQEQERQQGALLRGSERHGAVVSDDLDRAQDAEFHARRPLSQPGPKRILSAPIDGVPDPRNDRKEPQMIRAGDTIENPVTGERIVFRQTSRETNGQAVVIETYVQPNGFVAAAHVHPSQEERFEILRGSVGFRVGRKKLVAGPGHRLTVPAGTPHKFWNAGEDEAHFVCEVRPALQFEALLETMFALAADGKTNRKGMPNPLRLAVIANAHFDTVRLPVPAGHRAADRPRPRQPARARPRLPARLRPRRACGRCGRGVDLMRRRLFFTGLIAALLALAALGLVLRVARAGAAA